MEVIIIFLKNCREEEKKQENNNNINKTKTKKNCREVSMRYEDSAEQELIVLQGLSPGGNQWGKTCEEERTQAMHW